MRASPGFYVADMLTSIQWYEDYLGFKCTYKVPSESIPPYAIVTRDGVSIHLSLDRSASKIGTGFCYIETNHIDDIYTEFQEAGVIFLRTIEESSYGMRDFVIKDNEGNEISFGSVSNS